jgi:TraY domain
MPKLKRAPGGGAKPKGPFKGKKSTLTTRIMPETRAELVRSARENERSLSQEVEFRLRDFAEQSSTPKHHRALFDAISMLVAVLEGRTGKSCLEDTFTAEAVRQGILALLARLLPPLDKSPSIPPKLQAYADKVPSLKEGLANPVALGQLECEALIYAIESAPLTNHEASGLRFPAPEGLSRIRHDLAVGTKPEKK